MVDLPFTKQTSTVALAFFSLYFLYGLFFIPFTQFLVSLAVGGIVFGITDSYELATIALFAMNLLFPLLGGPTGVHTRVSEEGFVAVNPVEVSKRIQDLQRAHAHPAEPQGVGSPMSEGFADAGATDMTANTPQTTNTTAATATSQPAPTPAAPAPAPAPSTEVKKEEPKAISAQGVPPANQPATAGFQDNGSLFKLGQIPTDTKGGNHIDTGTTVMNALKALKPDQIKAMTDDTKQLIETQKSLMGMLQTFQPMMQEGKQMMQTFQTMFSPAAGASA
jgi:hypothetical protein